MVRMVRGFWILDCGFWIESNEGPPFFLPQLLPEHPDLHNVPISITFHELLAKRPELRDLWGNQLPVPGHTVPLTERPGYLVFSARPDPLAATVTRGQHAHTAPPVWINEEGQLIDPSK